MKQLYYVLRTLLRGRGSNVIKIVSLGLGLTMSILLFSRVAYEQSFDTCFRENERLYQLWMQWIVNDEVHSPSENCIGKLAGGIFEAMPDMIESATTTGRYPVSSPLYNGNIRFKEYKVVADSLFFQTMGIEVLSGNPVQDLAQKDVVYLSERLARKMFGDESPIGKVISYDKQWDLTVRGVYATLPDNCTMNPEAVISFPTVWSRRIGNYSWDGGDSWKEYIRLKPSCNPEVLNRRIAELVEQRVPKANGFGVSAKAAPIRDTYRGYEEVRRMRNIMSILGAAILFITALNYVLISISSLSRRAKAVGVHKCSGAGAGTVFGMFLWETAFIILGSLLLMELLMYLFRDFIEDTAAAKLASLFAPDRLWVPVGVTLLLFLVGGVLPGRIFSKIPVTQVFRRYTEGKKGWKRPLLFVQFAGVTFIGGLLCVVMLQYSYIIHKDVGYNTVRLAVGSHNIKNRTEGDAARHFYEGLPYVEQVSASWGYPSGGYSGEMIPDEAGTNLFSTRYDYCREDYAAMMGMTVLEGRPQREPDEVMVNEEFARRMHWGKEVLGRTFESEGGRVKVVGLLKDFQINDFTEEPLPYVMHYMDYFGFNINLRLKEPFAENLQRLNHDAAEAFPGKTLEFESLERLMADDYNSMRVFRNATLIATLAILFITLMGLIGYINDEMQRRSKEIAIRKVNGAEASMILELLTRDVLWTSVPAVLVGGVAAWYVNNLWMDMFAATISSPIPYYICIALAVLALIVACVVRKSWGIANENPVKSLKSE